MLPPLHHHPPSTTSHGELAEHTARDDAWIALEGIVYDITPHLNNHPGWDGAGVSTVLAIMNVLGTPRPWLTKAPPS